MIGAAEPNSAAQYRGTVPDAPSTDSSDAVIPGQQPPAGRERPGAWTMTRTVLVAGVMACCVAAALAAIVPPRTLIPGLPTAGALTDLALPAVRAIFDLSAAATIGWLLAAVFLVPPQRSGVLDVGGYRAVRAASVAATVWAVSALALVPLILSDTLGRPIDQSLSADEVLSGITVLDSVRASLWVAGVAALIAVISRVVLTPAAAGVLLAGALVVLIPVANTGHAAQSGNHDTAVDMMIIHLIGVSVWVGGLIAFVGLARQRVAHLPLIAHRYSGTALFAFVAVALSGLGNAWVRLASVQDLWLTDYGRLVLLKALLLVALGFGGWLHRRGTLPALSRSDNRRPLVRLAAVEILVMAATIGVASALSRTATPPSAPTAPSDTELVLGYDVSGPPTLWRLIADWRMDWVLGIAVIGAAVIYAVAVVRLRRRGVTWPAGRTVAWLLGCLAVLLAASSGLGRYAETQFSVHMIGHMALGMIAPILLVLGGPITLALRVLPAAGRDRPPGARELIVSVLHSRAARVITHPLVVFVLFIASFYAIYFTGLFETMITSHVGHLLMNVHFLVIGYLYYWVIIGVDPSPRRVHPMIKLGMLVGALPFHAFFGLALMNSRQAMATTYYDSLGLPWLSDLVADQRLGGAIAWGATEIPMIIVMIALLAQWARSDERDARRSDRQGNRAVDDELDSYNRMLAQLAERDRRTAPGDAGGAEDARPPGG